MSETTRQSIAATYDERLTGPRYHVTTKIAGKPLTWQHRVTDPFVRQTVTIGLWDLLRGLLHRHLVVEVLVDGDKDVIEDVLELNGDYLGPCCTRRDAFNARLNAEIERMAKAEGREL